MRINLKELTSQLIDLIGVHVIVKAILIGFLVFRNSQMSEMWEQFTIDKQELEDEYDFRVAFWGIGIDISN